METKGIKKKLINEINLSEDRSLLEELFRVLNLEKESKDAYKLNSEQKSAVAEAREQINQGDYLTDKQANQEMDQWLKQKVSISTQQAV